MSFRRFCGDLGRAASHTPEYRRSHLHLCFECVVGAFLNECWMRFEWVSDGVVNELRMGCGNGFG